MSHDDGENIRVGCGMTITNNESPTIALSLHYTIPKIYVTLRLKKDSEPEGSGVDRLLITYSINPEEYTKFGTKHHFIQLNMKEANCLEDGEYFVKVIAGNLEFCQLWNKISTSNNQSNKIIYTIGL
jgi:hypothetical protein